MVVRVLALDIATQTGVCADDPASDREIPRFWTWELSRVGGENDFGIRFHELGKRFDRLMSTMIDMDRKPDFVAFEEPLNVVRKMTRGSKPVNNRTTRLLIGLSAIVEERAKSWGVQTYEVPVSTAKAHFGGRTTDDDPKAAVRARCALLGWDVKNGDEADAAAIWSFVKCKADPKFSYVTTPLFGRRRA